MLEESCSPSTRSASGSISRRPNKARKRPRDRLVGQAILEPGEIGESALWTPAPPDAGTELIPSYTATTASRQTELVGGEPPGGAASARPASAAPRGYQATDLAH